DLHRAGRVAGGAQLVRERPVERGGELLVVGLGEPLEPGLHVAALPRVGLGVELERLEAPRLRRILRDRLDRERLVGLRDRTREILGLHRRLHALLKRLCVGPTAAADEDREEEGGEEGADGVHGGAPGVTFGVRSEVARPVRDDYT
ncbi:MAG: hypothetical protein ACK559_01995, partial [bacterium]